ncbi:MAG: hypothetical protein ACK56I_02780, partial [bacterium]
MAINAVSGIISTDRSTVGTYSVTFTGTVTGCTVSSTSVVNVLDAPTFGSVSQAAPVCDGSTATINLTGLVPGNLSNIRYSISGGTLGGAVTGTTNVTATAAGTASFTLDLTTPYNSALLRITEVRLQNQAVCAIATTASTTLTVYT